MTDDGARSAADLVGTWRLRAWTATADDGVEHPMGEPPEGILVYTADGTMITTIGRAGRPPIDGVDMLGGPEAQRLEAFTTFIAYSATFRMDGSDVVHDVTMSLFPNWIGTQQRRHVALSDDGRHLVLSTDPFVLRGRLSVQRLAWERVG
ncbi:MAG: lipocalin-like domain-containing protein [Candidatus Limnocylindrales bacterium]